MLPRTQQDTFMAQSHQLANTCWIHLWASQCIHIGSSPKIHIYTTFDVVFMPTSPTLLLQHLLNINRCNKSRDCSQSIGPISFSKQLRASRTTRVFCIAISLQMLSKFSLRLSIVQQTIGTLMLSTLVSKHSRSEAMDTCAIRGTYH